MPIYQSYNFNEYQEQVKALNSIQNFNYNGQQYNFISWGTTRYHSAITYTLTGMNATGEVITVRAALVK